MQEQKDPDPKHPPPPAVGGKQHRTPIPPPPEAGPPQKHPTAPPPSRSTSLRCQGTWSAQSPSVAFPVSPVGRQRVNWAPSPTCLGLAALSRGAWRGAGWGKVALQAGGDVLRMAPSTWDPMGWSGARHRRVEEPCWEWPSPNFVLGGRQGVSQAGRGRLPASPACSAALSPGAGWPLSPVRDGGECRAR